MTTRRLVSTLILSAAAATLPMTSAHASEATDAITSQAEWLADTASDCPRIDVSQDKPGSKDDAAITSLEQQGWYGIPGDGGEYLYAPSC